MDEQDAEKEQDIEREQYIITSAHFRRKNHPEHNKLLAILSFIFVIITHACRHTLWRTFLSPFAELG